MNDARRATRRLAILLAAFAALLGPGAAHGHEGPPYAIVVDRPTGPVLLSVWADPDVGTGTFHVYLEPLAGRPLPADAAVRIVVRPESGRLPERGWEAEPYRMKATRQHYVAEVEFDEQEWWSTRIVVAAGGRTAEAVTRVEVTPPGQGPLFDFVLYLFPFVAVGFLVVRALLSGRRKRRTPAA